MSKCVIFESETNKHMELTDAKEKIIGILTNFDVMEQNDLLTQIDIELKANRSERVKALQEQVKHLQDSLKYFEK